MTSQELYEIRRKWLQKHHTYTMSYWRDFDYKVLDNIMYQGKAGKRKGTYNDVIMMFDTETSKKPIDYDACYESHIMSVSDTVSDDLKELLSGIEFKWIKEYEAIATMKKMKKVGIHISKHGTML